MTKRGRRTKLSLLLHYIFPAALVVMLARKIMNDSTNILRLSAFGKLPDLVNESSEIDMDVFEELYHAGLLTGADTCSDGGRCYLEKKITLAGREKLKQDQEGRHLGGEVLIVGYWFLA